MLSRIYNSVRGYLGGVAAALGCFGLVLFAGGLPLSHLDAHFYNATPEAVARDFSNTVWHRLVPLFLTSLVLLSYGFYEAYKEQTSERA